MSIYNILGSINNGLMHKKNAWGIYDSDVRPYNVFILPDNSVKIADYLA